MALQHLRSSVANKRPIPTLLSAGQLAVNTNEASPGLFFKDSNGDLVKVGPVHIGTSAPNSSPASTAATALVTGATYQILTVGTSDFTLVGASANTVGTIFTATGTTTGTGTVSGQQGVEKGEMWLDTTGGTYVLKIYDGTAWRSESGTFVDAAGDTMTGALILPSGSAAAPSLGVGSTDNGIYSSNTDEVAISTNGTARMVVDSDGDVGIGTQTPSSMLHVLKTQASPTSATLAEFGTTSISNGLQIITTDGDSTWGFNATNVRNLTFRTVQTERLFISGSTGYLGVGTNTPSEKFTVFASDPVLLVQDSDTSIAYANATVRLAESGGSNTVDNYWDIAAKPFTGSNFGFNIGTQSISSCLHIKHGTGNVGISTTSPSTSTKLDVNGAIHTTTGIYFASDFATNSRLDDYQQGSFTPSLTNLSTSLYTINAAKYVKIGNSVQWFVDLYIATNSDQDAFVLSSLPFTADTSSHEYPVYGQIDDQGEGSTNLRFYQVGTNVYASRYSNSTVTYTSLDNNNIYLGGSYISS